MPLRKTQFATGEYYHIFNRGNARRDIFHCDHDMYRFLQAIYVSNNNNATAGVSELERNRNGHTIAEIKLIFDNEEKYNPFVKICADCLMPNHYHLLVQEVKEGGIIKFMQRLGNSYSRYYTVKYDKPGSLFQGRFKSVHIESDEQLKYLLVYINAINPGQLVEPNLKEIGIKDINKVWDKVESYKWSSHFDFLGKRSSLLLDDEFKTKFFLNKEDYINLLKDTLIGLAEENENISDVNFNGWKIFEDMDLD